MNKEYPCRTEVVNGISYHIKMFRNGKLIGSTSCQSKEETDNYINRMQERLPDYRFEVTENSWTAKVCIECGQESY